jgi:hypothetical protein
MNDAQNDLLKRVIELQHGGTASRVQSVKLLDPRATPAPWDGVVHIYDLAGHAKAKRAYAWTSTIDGSGAERYFAVLHMGRVNTPIAAVKAAAKAIQKWGKAA